MSSIEFTHSNDKAREQFPSFFTGNRKTCRLTNVFDGSFSHVPMVTKLRNGRSVTVNYMTEGQLTEMYCMIQEAAQCGNSVGKI
jgi:hypothetical protein